MSSKNKNSILEDIKNGKGLKPLDHSKDKGSSKGITDERRDRKGVTTSVFTKVKK